MCMKFYPVSFFTGIIDTHRFPSAMHMHTYRSNWIRMGLQSDITQYMDCASMKLQLPIYTYISSARVAHFKLVLYAAHYIQCYQSVYFKQNANCIRNLLLVILVSGFLVVIFVCSLTYYFEYNLINSTE